jgi:polysaccharide export outer membrane protein
MHATGIAGRGAVWLMVMIFCASPAMAQMATEPQAPPVAARAVPTGAQASVNYRLLPTDTVHVKVFQEEDLETTARIDNDGNIFFPLLGKAKIGGQTLQEATATIQSALNTYLVHPEVSIEIISYARQQFSMMGQVNKQGVFDFPNEGSLDLLQAIALAGGYTKIANPSKILIKRVVNGQETIIKVDGKKLLDPKHNAVSIPEILPGDTIQVGEAIF